MESTPERFSINCDQSETVTGLLYLAAKRSRVGTTVLLAHGAGANQLSSFMRLFANGLAIRGFDTVTFNFSYSEKGRRSPDPKAKLESCYRAAIESARNHKKLKGNRVIIGGKSMGGRIGSQVVAINHESLQNRPDKIAGLVFLGYPLHPPGRPEQLRDEHLKDIDVPMLFLQGSKDAFGTGDEIQSVINRLSLPATVYLIEGGDHSFKVPKSSANPQPQVYEAMMDQIVRWWQSVTGD
jgi:predicted alpha/beta-hydrolase family hydrolase